MYGKAGVEIANYGKKLRPINKECGVIAGNASSMPDRIFAIWLGLKGHDGKILVDETRVDGMTDFLQFTAVHPELPKTPGVILQTLSFLQAGQFCGTKSTSRSRL